MSGVRAGVGDDGRYLYPATLIEVTDGDTVKLWVDQGLDTFKKLKVRLYGLDCPERKDPVAWVQARQFTVDWFASFIPVFELETIKDKTEKYGRYLGIVRYGERSLNEALLSSGNAKPWEGRGPHPTFEKEAE